MDSKTEKLLQYIQNGYYIARRVHLYKNAPTPERFVAMKKTEKAGSIVTRQVDHQCEYYQHMRVGLQVLQLFALLSKKAYVITKKSLLKK